MFLVNYEHALSEENCYRLISLFESVPDLHQIYDSGMPQWTELNLTEHRSRWEDLFLSLSRLWVNSFTQFITETGALCPRPTLLEEFRMKRYTGTDRFDLHTDVVNHDTAKRYLVGLLYLNTPEGGEIEFPQYDKKIQPKQGDFLVFPPLWTHGHIAHPVAPNDRKYLITSYAHYE
jgi:hypothetical protein